MGVGSAGQVQMASEERLSLPLLAERIAHEGASRLLAAEAIENEAKLRKVFDRHERQSRKAEERAVEKARATQFREYERRLNALNHAQTMAVEAQARTVPRETFDRYTAEIERRLGLVERAQTQMLAERVGSRGVQSWVAPNLGSIIAIVLGVVALYLVLARVG